MKKFKQMRDICLFLTILFFTMTLATIPTIVLPFLFMFPTAILFCLWLKLRKVYKMSNYVFYRVCQKDEELEIPKRTTYYFLVKDKDFDNGIILNKEQLPSSYKDLLAVQKANNIQYYNMTSEEMSIAFAKSNKLLEELI